jgi:hypothetical protein
MTTVTEANEFSLTVNGEMIDTTRFQDVWNRRIQGLKSAEGSITDFYVDNFFFTKLLAGDPVVLELYSQDTNIPERLFALLNADEVAAVVDGAVVETLSFESTDELLLAYAT